MGQQQLLLMVMAIVIVAIAVMAGLTAWETIMQQSETDTLISRNLEIASSAVFWKTKRDPFAGGNQSYEGLNENGFQQLFMEIESHNGRFSISSSAPAELIITAVSKRYPFLGARTYVTNYRVDSTIVSNRGTIVIP